MINKPASWAFNSANVHPDWQWFWDDRNGVCWPMWENTGTVLNDLDDLGKDIDFAASTEDPAWGADSLGVCVAFDGDDWADLNTTSGLGAIIKALAQAGGDDFTFFIVLRPTEVGDQYWVCSDHDGSGANESLYLRQTSGDKWQCGVNAETDVTSTTSVADDTLAVLVVTFEEGATNGLKLYVNGSLEAQANAGATLVDGADFRLGRPGAFAGGNRFNGNILLAGVQAGVWDSTEVADWSADPFKVLEEDAGGGGPTLTQSAYQFLDDDAGEGANTPLAAENENYAIEKGVPFRLRIQLDASGDPSSIQPRLEYRKVGDTDWIPVPVA